MRKANVWVAVLAAGDGKRVQSHTLDHRGMSIPKQFWRFDGRRSLLRATLQRAQALCPAARIVPVVAEQHRPWWERELRGIPKSNIMVQPENRGTAAGILLPLLHIFRCDPDAILVVLPSDHAVRHEKILARSLRDAVVAVEQTPDAAVLLGITPDYPDPEYGWILPRTPAAGATRRVAAFVEKPSLAAARGLLAGGALWNSFMFAVTARTLLRMFGEHEPEVLGSFLDVLAESPTTSSEALRGLYRVLPSRDFSRHVLQCSTSRLRTLAVPACGWLDIGTPDRLASWSKSRPEPTTPFMPDMRRAVA